jgi:tetratricopeptide (TPR) repeat protein
VDETNLAVMISTVRKLLGDNGHTQKYIETVAKTGYRFAAEVRRSTPPDPTQESPVLPAAVAPLCSARSFRPMRTAPFLLILLAVAISGGLLLYGLRWRIVNGAERNRRNAQTLYLKGRYAWSRGSEVGLNQSVAYFTQAITEDPRSALAYAGLADAYLSMATWSVESSDISYRKAREAAGRALALDDSLSQSHAASGMVAMVHEWNLERAGREFRRAVELGPNDPLAHQRLGLYLAAKGRLADALAEMRKASDLDPLDLHIGVNVGLILYYSRRYAEAMDEYRKVIALDSHYSVAHYYLGVAYYVQSDFRNAIPELEEASRLVHDREPLSLGLYAAACARNGDPAAARAVLQQLRQRSSREYISPYGLALLYLGLGERDQALERIERMFHDHIITALFAGFDPLFDPLRSDPRFAALLRSLVTPAESAGVMVFK